MRKLILISLFFEMVAFSQQSNYEKGVLAFSNEEYTYADSLFSLDIYETNNPNSYYNRGIIKLFFNDTIGFCNDLATSSISDSESIVDSIYKSNCYHNIDTSYYDKSYKLIQKGKHRFYEIRKYLRYKKVIEGEIHDLKSDLMRGELSNSEWKVKKIDLIATFVIKDSIKIFNQTLNYPDLKNRSEINKFNLKAENYINSKYSQLVRKYGLDKIEIYFSYIVDDNGDVINVKYSKVTPNVDLKEIKEDLLSDVEVILKKYKYEPGKFFQKDVFFSLNYRLIIK